MMTACKLHWPGFKEEQMAKNEKVYAETLELAKSFDDNFVELGARLRLLHDGDMDSYNDLLKASNIDRRKAYYLIGIDKTFGPLKISKKKLTALGWTKLMTIQPYVNKSNVAQLLEQAENNTVAKLKKIVKGEEPSDNTHAVLMYFSPEQYDVLQSVLLANGAEKAPRGLVNKEQARMTMIEKLNKYADGRQSHRRSWSQISQSCDGCLHFPGFDRDSNHDR